MSIGAATGFQQFGHFRPRFRATAGVLCTARGNPRQSGRVKCSFAPIVAMSVVAGFIQICSINKINDLEIPPIIWAGRAEISENQARGRFTPGFPTRLSTGLVEKSAMRADGRAGR